MKYFWRLYYKVFKPKGTTHIGKNAYVVAWARCNGKKVKEIRISKSYRFYEVVK